MVVAALRRCGGAARRSELLERGVTPRQLSLALRRGQIMRAHRGTYYLPGTSLDVIHATVFRGQLTCLSACQRWGLPIVTPPATTHLWVPESRSASRVSGRPVDKVTLHRLGTDPTDEAPIAVVVALDLLGLCVSGPAQLAAIDGALNRGLLDFRDLHEFTVTHPARQAWLQEHADPQADSLLETLARLVLTQAKLPIQSQAVVDGVGRVDFLVAGRVVVEVDGHRHHTGLRAFTRDRERDRALVLRGYTVLRFTFRDVVDHPDRLVREISEALSLAHVRSAPRL